MNWNTPNPQWLVGDPYISPLPLNLIESQSPNERKTNLYTMASFSADKDNLWMRTHPHYSLDFGVQAQEQEDLEGDSNNIQGKEDRWGRLQQ